jgi:hypothetical protein
MFEEFDNTKTYVADFKPFHHRYEVIKFKINIGRNPIIYDEDDENNISEKIFAYNIVYKMLTIPSSKCNILFNAIGTHIFSYLTGFEGDVLCQINLLYKNDMEKLEKLATFNLTKVVRDFYSCPYYVDVVKEIKEDKPKTFVTITKCKNCSYDYKYIIKYFKHKNKYFKHKNKLTIFNLAEIDSCNEYYGYF